MPSGRSLFKGKPGQKCDFIMQGWEVAECRYQMPYQSLLGYAHCYHEKADTDSPQDIGVMKEDMSAPSE